MRALVLVVIFITTICSCRSVKKSEQSSSSESATVEHIDSNIVSIDFVDSNWYKKQMLELRSGLLSEFQDYGEIYASVIGAVTDDNKLSSAQRDSLIKLLMQIRQPSAKIVRGGSSIELVGMKNLNHSFDSMFSVIDSLKYLLIKNDSTTYDKDKATTQTEAKSNATVSRKVTPLQVAIGLIILLIILSAIYYYLKNRK